jgi:DNA-binding Lrp family transcriptional regulator
VHKVDTVDRVIVDLLMEDGRMPSAETARRIGGVSERSVRYRLQRQIDRGIVRVSAIPAPRAPGFSVVADVFIEVEPGHVMDVARRVTEHTGERRWGLGPTRTRSRLPAGTQRGTSSSPATVPTTALPIEWLR